MRRILLYFTNNIVKNLYKIDILICIDGYSSWEVLMQMNLATKLIYIVTVSDKKKLYYTIILGAALLLFVYTVNLSKMDML